MGAVSIVHYNGLRRPKGCTTQESRKVQRSHVPDARGRPAKGRATRLCANREASPERPSASIRRLKGLTTSIYVVGDGVAEDGVAEWRLRKQGRGSPVVDLARLEQQHCHLTQVEVTTLVFLVLNILLCKRHLVPRQKKFSDFLGKTANKDR